MASGTWRGNRQFRSAQSSTLLRNFGQRSGPAGWRLRPLIRGPAPPVAALTVSAPRQGRHRVAKGRGSVWPFPSPRPCACAHHRRQEYGTAPPFAAEGLLRTALSKMVALGSASYLTVFECPVPTSRLNISSLSFLSAVNSAGGSLSSPSALFSPQGPMVLSRFSPGDNKGRAVE